MASLLVASLPGGEVTINRRVNDYKNCCWFKFELAAQANAFQRLHYTFILEYLHVDCYGKQNEQHYLQKWKKSFPLSSGHQANNVKKCAFSLLSSIVQKHENNTEPFMCLLILYGAEVGLGATMQTGIAGLLLAC